MAGETAAIKISKETTVEKIELTKKDINELVQVLECVSGVSPEARRLEKLRTNLVAVQRSIDRGELLRCRVEAR